MVTKIGSIGAPVNKRLMKNNCQKTQREKKYTEIIQKSIISMHFTTLQERLVSLCFKFLPTSLFKFIYNIHLNQIHLHYSLLSISSTLFTSINFVYIIHLNQIHLHYSLQSNSSTLFTSINFICIIHFNQIHLRYSQHSAHL